MDHCKEQGPSNLGAQVSKLGSVEPGPTRGSPPARPQPDKRSRGGCGGALAVLPPPLAAVPRGLIPPGSDTRHQLPQTPQKAAAGTAEEARRRLGLGWGFSGGTTFMAFFFLLFLFAALRIHQSSPPRPRGENTLGPQGLVPRGCRKKAPPPRHTRAFRGSKEGLGAGIATRGTSTPPTKTPLTPNLAHVSPTKTPLSPHSPHPGREGGKRGGEISLAKSYNKRG